uniref:Cation transporting ATPase C-terminal domain-containing protein n=1 Tax=Candidatus Phytoplasma australasiaticum subsp. australasiaticum TaxID=2832407 RepID=A0A7S7FZP5_9MOLU|nr:cation transporting ATPase C-terminal domain-containing protein ['Parthenium hysterophorus' phyllody phytoplasma]
MTIYFSLKTKNPIFIIYFIISFLVQLIILFIPICQKYFNLAKLSFWDINIIMFLSLSLYLLLNCIKNI